MRRQMLHSIYAIYRVYGEGTQPVSYRHPIGLQFPDCRRKEIAAGSGVDDIYSKTEWYGGFEFLEIFAYLDGFFKFIV